MDQWAIIRRLPPADLEQSARLHGAMRGQRGQIRCAEQLLRVLLMHVAGGLSVEQTVARAGARGLATLNLNPGMGGRKIAAGRWGCTTSPRSGHSPSG